MWINFYIEDLDIHCEAKVFSRPSQWGINNSRISKLNVWTPQNDDYQLTYEYDRGSINGSLDDNTINKIIDYVA